MYSRRVFSFVDRQVKIWFQNRRSKMKKQNRPMDADSSSSSNWGITSDQASPTDHHGTGARRYHDDPDDARRMYPPDSSVVYRRPQSASAFDPYSRRLPGVPAEPAASSHANKMEQLMMTSCHGDVDADVIQSVRRHDDHDLLTSPARQLVLPPSLQLLTGFHAPAAAAATAAGVGNSESSAWSNFIPLPPVRDAAFAVGQQMAPINCELQDASNSSSSSYLPWYTHHLMDSYNLR